MEKTKIVIDYQLNGINDGGQQFIRIRERKMHTELGVELSNKTGFIEVTPGKKAAAVLEGLKNESLGWSFGPRNRQTNLYPVKLIIPGLEEELEEEQEQETEGVAVKH